MVSFWYHIDIAEFCTFLGGEDESASYGACGSLESAPCRLRDCQMSSRWAFAAGVIPASATALLGLDNDGLHAALNELPGFGLGSAHVEFLA